MEYIFLGLGNTKEKYKGSVHNIGQDFVSALAQHSAQGWQDFGSFKIAPVLFGGHSVLCVSTNGYMNESGADTNRLLSFIRSSRLVVVHDDIALPFGAIRLSHKKSSAGHKGVESVAQAIGSSDFIRLRIGVGREGDVKDYVLQQIPEEKKAELRAILREQIPKIFAQLLQFDVQHAMTHCNAAPTPQQSTQSTASAPTPQQNAQPAASTSAS